MVVVGALGSVTGDCERTLASESFVGMGLSCCAVPAVACNPAVVMVVVVDVVAYSP